MILRGVKGGVHHGHDRLGIGEELLDQGIKFGDELRFPRGKIVFLAQIITQVEQ